MLLQNDKIIIVSGDFYLSKDFSNKVLGEFNDSNGVTTLSSPSGDDLLRFLLTDSLFGGRQLIRVYDFKIDKKINLILSRFLNSKGETLLLVNEPDVKKAKKLYELMKKNNSEGVRLESFNSCSKKKDARNFIAKRCVEIGLNFTNGADEALILRCGLNYAFLDGELEKLKIIFDNKLISDNLVLEVIDPLSHEACFLELYLAIQYRNLPETIRCVRELVSKVGVDAVFSVLMKILEACIIISSHKGDIKNAYAFVKKRRSEFSFSSFKDEKFFKSKIKDQIPSAFLYKVSGNIANRIRNTDTFCEIFLMCHASLLSFRSKGSLYSANMSLEKISCILSK